MSYHFGLKPWDADRLWLSEVDEYMQAVQELRGN